MQRVNQKQYSIIMSADWLEKNTEQFEIKEIGILTEVQCKNRKHDLLHFR